MNLSPLALRFHRCAAIALLVSGVAMGGCTLLLATDQIIKPCQADDACADGFSCQANACLPDDPGDAAGEGEGEGEGEGAAEGEVEAQ